MTPMANLSTERSLTRAQRQRAAANALASVRAEGLDPSGAEPALAAWARGEIDTDQMIAATQSAATAHLSPQPQAT